jgi:hypothetical protein
VNKKEKPTEGIHIFKGERRTTTVVVVVFSGSGGREFKSFEF